MELRGVRNGEHLDPIGAELLPDRVGDVEQQRNRELRRVERVERGEDSHVPGTESICTSGQLASWNSGRGFLVVGGTPVGGTAVGGTALGGVSG